MLKPGEQLQQSDRNRGNLNMQSNSDSVEQQIKEDALRHTSLAWSEGGVQAAVSSAFGHFVAEISF